jgi:hypothetical protein
MHFHGAWHRGIYNGNISDGVRRVSSTVMISSFCCPQIEIENKKLQIFNLQSTSAHATRSAYAMATGALDLNILA